MRNQAQLITYADRLGGSLAGLRTLLEGPLAGAFGGVHVLPFFPPFDGADAGFDPVDHTVVDPRLGSWDDIEALGCTLDTVVDVIVNHVSRDSAAFVDWAARGVASDYDGMFLTLGAVFPHGAHEADLAAVFRPRPGLPFTATRVAGRTRLLWTTFTPAQIDLDTAHPAATAYLDEVLATLARHGVRTVRMDAIGYAVKTPGTSCFMTPNTLELVADLTARTRALGMEALVEVHAHHTRQQEVAPLVDWVYDFALPPLLLHGLFTGDAAPLQHWLAVRPSNAVTVLDTHDGIGVMDVGADALDPHRPALLDPEQLAALVEGIHQRSSGTSRPATGAGAGNLDLYQVNCTFADALGRDEGRYLLARLVQVFVPGVPQVYYVGLLHGTNDTELLARTGVGRDVNRHRYSPAELAEALRKPVVVRQLALLRWRNAHPAFAGTCTATPLGPSSLRLGWVDGPEEAVLEADLATAEFTLAWTMGGERREIADLADLPG